VHVQVDGGISAENAAAVRKAGADLLVAGSAVFAADDPAAAYRRLAALVA
jgi:ribulose-phosphate 3-epimerase